jgi:hypothetical protein
MGERGGADAAVDCSSSGQAAFNNNNYSHTMTSSTNTSSESSSSSNRRHPLDIQNESERTTCVVVSGMLLEA